MMVRGIVLGKFVGFSVEIKDTAGDAARHALRSSVDRKRAGDVVWALIDPAMYQLLVNEMSWTPAQFRKWLADTLADQLLQR